MSKSKRAKRANRKPPEPKEATSAKSERKGVKAQVAALLLGGGSYTVEELKAKTGGQEITVKTSLSDLKSAKYAGATGPLPIVVKDGRYRLLGEGELAQLGEAMAKEGK